MSAEWEEKIWGQVMHVFADPHAAVSLLEVNAGYRCSVHYHEHRVNQFCVTAGRIVVEEYHTLGYQDSVAPHELGVGDVLIVPAGIWHCFRVLESGTVVENYWSANGAPVEIDDIIRQDVGGKDDGTQWDSIIR